MDIERLNNLPREVVVEFLIRMDDYFQPPVASKVNLSEYAIKLCAYGEVYGVRSGRKLIALIAYYCNDVHTRDSYISYIAVDVDYRGQGIAEVLLEHCLRDVSHKGFQRCRVTTWKGNDSGICLYEKAGFVVANEYQDNNRMSLELIKVLR